jgi:hypothetical protein
MRGRHYGVGLSHYKQRDLASRAGASGCLGLERPHSRNKLFAPSDVQRACAGLKVTWRATSTRKVKRKDSRDVETRRAAADATRRQAATPTISNHMLYVPASPTVPLVAGTRAETRRKRATASALRAESRRAAALARCARLWRARRAAIGFRNPSWSPDTWCWSQQACWAQLPGALRRPHNPVVVTCACARSRICPATLARPINPDPFWPAHTETRSGARADAQGCERTREEAQEPRLLVTGFETQAEPKPAAALAKWRRRVR